MTVTHPSMYLIASLLLGCAIGGCVQPQRQVLPPPPVEPAHDPIPKEYYPHIVMTPSLEGVILRSPPSVTRDANVGTLQVVAPMRSTLNHELLVEYRMLFMGPNGNVQNPDTSWRSLQFGPRMQATAQGASTRSDTADWRLEVRPLRSR